MLYDFTPLVFISTVGPTCGRTHSRFDVRTPSIPLELKCKAWDDLSRAGLYEHKLVNTSTKSGAQDNLAAQLLGVTEELDIYRTKVKHLEDNDFLSKIGIILRNCWRRQNQRPNRQYGSTP